MVVFLVMEAEGVVSLHRAFSAACPDSLKGDALNEKLSALYEEAVPNLERLIKRPDGSRALQLVFRRGDEALRSRLLQDLTPHLFTIATTRYSCHIFKALIRHGSVRDVALLVSELKGSYDRLLPHVIGMKSLDLLFEKTNQEGKKQIFMDFFGSKWKSEAKVTEFSEICKEKGAIRDAAVKSLTTHLTHAFDKGAGKLTVALRLLSLLGRENRSILGQFVIYLKDMGFSRIGSLLSFDCIKSSKQNELIASLRLLEDTLRKSIIPTSEAVLETSTSASTAKVTTARALIAEECQKEDASIVKFSVEVAKVGKESRKTSSIETTTIEAQEEATTVEEESVEEEEEDKAAKSCAGKMALDKRFI
jgi:hypothetical protein